MVDQLDPSRIAEVGVGFRASKALLSAAELGLFTELARGPLRAAELQDRLGLHPRGALDFFDALVALGFLDRRAGVYANTPETDWFLDRAKPSYIGGRLEMYNARLYPHWVGLTDSLRTGQPQSEARSTDDYFRVLYHQPERLRLFLRAMTGLSRETAQVIAERFPWGDYRSFLDIGTAEGCLPVEVARRHEHLRGGGFDLPPVRPVFEDYVAAQGLANRLSFHAGDFFADPLPSADVLVLGHILHDWNLEEKQALLAKAYEALPGGGALLIYEALIDDERRQNAYGLLASLNMLVMTRGGFDFTGRDCLGWVRDAGFREARVEHLIGADSMVVGFK